MSHYDDEEQETPAEEEEKKEIDCFPLYRDEQEELLDIAAQSGR